VGRLRSQYRPGRGFVASLRRVCVTNGTVGGRSGGLSGSERGNCRWAGPYTPGLELSGERKQPSSGRPPGRLAPIVDRGRRSVRPLGADPRWMLEAYTGACGNCG
jgi:hypothetical protein